MKFFELLETLKTEYKDNCVVRKNGTLVLGPGKMPRALHMLFAPLSEDDIDEFLVQPCCYEFPKEYIEFLKYSNGAVLHTAEYKLKNGLSFAHSMFTIYGLPKTPPYERPENMEEPFDLRVEDNRRHPKTSQHWIKCGAYIRESEITTVIYIFIDTKTKEVYGCTEKKATPIEHWSNLDECFCDIFSRFSTDKLCFHYDL